ncbi:MAG: AraC family transcriptional regulator [Blautia sp.]|nr:AraC family transcriptional regulator [Blautia sp.]
MKLNYLTLNEKLEETICHGTDDYPLEIYIDEVNKYPEGYICWHWHKEHEMLYVINGEVELYTGQNVYYLKKNEGAWIVPNMLHMIKPVSVDQEAVICAILADTSLLCGFRGSRIHRKYIMPFFENRSMDAYILKPYVLWQQEMLNLFSRCYDLYQDENPGYDWEIVIALQKSGLILVKNAASVERTVNASDLEDHTRVKKAIAYIHKHYHEKIYLQDIADSVPVSRCECCRLFRKVIHQSPMDYLISYRVQMAEYLLMNSDKSILDIALETGFSNSSHLSKMFQRKLHCTPLRYRKII